MTPQHDLPTLTPTDRRERSTEMPWPNMAHQRFEQRRLAERIIAEVLRLRQAIDRHPRCRVELDRVASVLHELTSLSAELVPVTDPPRVCVE